MHTRTTTALLDDLLDPANERAWVGFDARYRPVLIGFARQLGLRADDAADIAQEALTKFVRAYQQGQYRRERGRLSSWLITIARNCVVDAERSRAVRRERHGLSALGEFPDEQRLTMIWEGQREREVLRQALLVLRQETNVSEQGLAAFTMIAIHRRAPADVAAELDMTRNDVYLAKHRCLKRLRSIVAQLESAWDDRTEDEP